jgi:hypothetical protein
MTARYEQTSIDPEYGDPRLPARFWAKVEVAEGGCWLWTAYRKRDGYGQFRVSRATSGLAHRVAFEAFLGPVPQGLELDHFVCDTPACVRPSHLCPTTHRSNVLRGRAPTALNARKTTCRWGHPLTVRLLPGRPPSRRCVRCNRLWLACHAARRRAGPPPVSPLPWRTER